VRVGRPRAICSLAPETDVRPRCHGGADRPGPPPRPTPANAQSLTELVVERGILTPGALYVLGLTARPFAGQPLAPWEMALPALFVWALYAQVAYQFARAAHFSRSPGRLHVTLGTRHPALGHELVMVTVIALVCGTQMALLFPSVVLLRVLLLSIPDLEGYLAERHHDEWRLHARRTPWIFVPYTI